MQQLQLCVIGTIIGRILEKKKWNQRGQVCCEDHTDGAKVWLTSEPKYLPGEKKAEARAFTPFIIHSFNRSFSEHHHMQVVVHKTEQSLPSWRSWSHSRTHPGPGLGSARHWKAEVDILPAALGLGAPTAHHGSVVSAVCGH